MEYTQILFTFPCSLVSNVCSSILSDFGIAYQKQHLYQRIPYFKNERSRKRGRKFPFSQPTTSSVASNESRPRGSSFVTSLCFYFWHPYNIFPFHILNQHKACTQHMDINKEKRKGIKELLFLSFLVAYYHNIIAGCELSLLWEVGYKYMHQDMYIIHFIPFSFWSQCQRQICLGGCTSFSSQVE